MLFQGGYIYYITIGLQLICVLHSLKRGTFNKWVYLIVFLPIVGSIAYIFMEILPSSRRVRTPQLNVGAMINPSGRIKKLEDNLKFADTFNNRIVLADAYLAAGMTDQAIALYEDSLTGAFAENEHGLAQLMQAYFQAENYDKVIAIGRRIYRLPQFARSKAHLTYAMALEENGNIAEAETEFKSMVGRYSYYQQRYQYALFLIRIERYDDARKVLADMLDESEHLSSMERRNNREWFSNARNEMRKLPVKV